MRRVHDKDINSPEYFDKMWNLLGHKYDPIRLVYLLKQVRLADTVCELGCGWFGALQYATAVLGMDIKAYVVDFSKEALRKSLMCAPYLKVHLGDVLHTPYTDSKFDVVIAGELIEHMDQPEALVKEMSRICKPGGYLNISTVDPDCEDGKHLKYPEHVFRFTPEDLITLFSPYGKPEYRMVGNYLTISCKTYGTN